MFGAGFDALVTAKDRERGNGVSTWLSRVIDSAYNFWVQDKNSSEG